MAQNKIVVRYQDGRMLKGNTDDFFPGKEVFHVTQQMSPPSKPLEIRVSELKAVFFVKDLTGDSKRQDLNDFSVSNPSIGRKIKVVFKDGEVLMGTTQGYQPNRPGFFLVPIDPKSNNDRCFIVLAATKEVSFI